MHKVANSKVTSSYYDLIALGTNSCQSVLVAIARVEHVSTPAVFCNGPKIPSFKETYEERGIDDFGNNLSIRSNAKLRNIKWKKRIKVHQTALASRIHTIGDCIVSPSLTVAVVAQASRTTAQVHTTKIKSSHFLGATVCYVLCASP